MREGASLADGYWRILLPSFAAAFVPFVLFWLPGAHWRLGLLVAALALTVVIALVSLRVPWRRLPQWTRSVPAFAYLGAFVLIRAAGGPSGVAPMALLPVFWLAVYGTPRQLWALLVGIALVLLVPIVSGGPDYPPSTWRAALLFLVFSAVVGCTMQSLVGYARRQERERERLMSRLEELAHTDALTSLANRHAWQAELDRGLARARRTGDPVSLALVDIDSFKAVNDLYGHSGGDSLLVDVARAWKTTLRPDDVLARIGGDEFALLMPGCGASEAAILADRLQSRMPAPHTCSIGIATWDREEGAGQLMVRADESLYEAKRVVQSGGHREIVVRTINV
ncbi:MAG TPA: GGDEF domain-containing protein [Solirubrobacteraceae bacterium]|jgi:diguanylate cyclase (GGDEF)-like protein